VTEDCPVCELLNCFYKKLKLSLEERRIMEKLHDNPEKAIEYLRKIKSDNELRLAFKSCREKKM